MKVGTIILLLLAVVVLAGGAGADEYFDEEDFEIDEEDFWQSALIDVPGNATFSIDINMTDPKSGERDNFTGIDIYLLTEDEFDNYKDDEEFETLEHSSWENRNLVQWSKPLEDELISFFIIIDNRNNSRDSDAVPNGTVTVDVNWTVIEAEVIDPIDTGADTGTSDGDMTTFIILAVIVLAVMMGIGMAVRRGGSGGEGDDDSEEKEDYFGRVRIG